MTIIVDSGSTKTDWCFITAEGQALRLVTKGINPIVQPEHDVESAILSGAAAIMSRGKDLDLIHNCISRCADVLNIFYYGAGCIGKYSKIVENALSKAFADVASINVMSDLYGSARSLFADEPGIACILGTGSNSCLFDGTAIVNNIPPLGYVLGDEGSGTSLGKMFINALFKNGLPSSLRDEYLANESLSLQKILDIVYHGDKPNAFLASTSLFIAKHLDCEDIRNIVIDNFRFFFRNNVARYGRQDLPIGVIGSIAWTYRQFLSDVCAEFGYKLAKISKSPMEGLLRYHLGYKPLV